MSPLLPNILKNITKNTVTRFTSYNYSSSSSQSSASSLLKILPEVSEALSLGKPIVALESTILAHGLPPPENIQLARDISKIIRSRGAVPATIAGEYERLHEFQYVLSPMLLLIQQCVNSQGWDLQSRVDPR